MKMMGSRAATRAATIAIAGLGALTLAGTLPAEAHRASTTCPTKFLLCVWSDSNYTGVRGGFTELGISNAILANDNDDVSSLKVKKGYTAILYSDADGQGESRCFDGPVRRARFLDDWSFNDQASSSRVKKGSKCPAATRCPDDARLCLWQDRGFLGPRVVLRKRGLSNKLSKVMDNGASSLIENVKDRFFLYDGTDGHGSRICGHGGGFVANLGVYGFDDKASSTRITKPRPCPAAKRAR